MTQFSQRSKMKSQRREMWISACEEPDPELALGFRETPHASSVPTFNR
jgi:hypothetical protein